MDMEIRIKYTNQSFDSVSAIIEEILDGFQLAEIEINIISKESKPKQEPKDI